MIGLITFHCTNMVLSLQALSLLVAAAKSARLRRQLLLIALLVCVERPLIPAVRFRLDSMTTANSVLDFRFDVQDIKRLAHRLRLPSVVITGRGNRVHRDEALCVVLNRLAYPRRYYDMMRLFGRSRESLADIFLHLIHTIYDTWQDNIFLHKGLLVANMDRYCDAVAAQGSPLARVYGFIDGTKLQTCRIGATHDGVNLQKEIYSGHKRMHCLNYQAVSAPDGICIHFWGPLEGRRHDSTMLLQSGLLEALDSDPDLFRDNWIYGDPAYGINSHVLSGFKGNQLSERQRRMNSDMSRVRQSVEWNFKIMKCLWAFVSYKNQSKIRLSPVGKIAALAMFLTNCHCCFYGNQISSFFGLQPPTLESYLNYE